MTHAAETGSFTNESPRVDSEAASFVAASRLYDELMYRDHSGGRFDEGYWFVRERQERYCADLRSFAAEHPDAFEMLTADGTDGFHGTTSLNIAEIARRGLLASKELARLGVLALGRENFSIPDNRAGLHVVPLGNVAETKRYAEARLDPDSSDMVNPFNYKNVLLLSPEYRAQFVGQETNYAHYFLGRYDEAVRMQELANAGKLDKRPYPVVIGFSSNALPSSAALRRCESVIVGDAVIDTRVPTEAFRHVFTPTDNVEQLQGLFDELGLPVPVHDIAMIR